LRPRVAGGVAEGGLGPPASGRPGSATAPAWRLPGVVLSDTEGEFRGLPQPSRGASPRGSHPTPPAGGTRIVPRPIGTARSCGPRAGATLPGTEAETPMVSRRLRRGRCHARDPSSSRARSASTSSETAGSGGRRRSPSALAIVRGRAPPRIWSDERVVLVARALMRTRTSDCEGRGAVGRISLGMSLPAVSSPRICRRRTRSGLGRSGTSLPRGQRRDLGRGPRDRPNVGPRREGAGTARTPTAADFAVGTRRSRVSLGVGRIIPTSPASSRREGGSARSGRGHPRRSGGAALQSRSAVGSRSAFGGGPGSGGSAGPDWRGGRVSSAGR
jgi:hypothetical protein